MPFGSKCSPDGLPFQLLNSTKEKQGKSEKESQPDSQNEISRGSVAIWLFIHYGTHPTSRNEFVAALEGKAKHFFFTVLT